MTSRSKKKSKGPQTPLSDAMQECMDILKYFQTRPEAEPFLVPVDWELYDLHDYPEIIKHPMDLGTIQSKLEEGKYKDVNAFAADMTLVWENCKTYNRPDSELYMTADKFHKQFEKKIAKVKTSIASTSTKKAGASPIGKGEENIAAQNATRPERLKFSSLVNSLSPEQLGRIVDMIQKECPDALNEDGKEEIEIEINLIDGETLAKLNAYAVACVNGGEHKKQKTK